MRLRTVSPNAPGWTRRRCGKGFLYLDEEGNRLNGTSVERIKSLVIPPAWREVWICPYDNGHIQAVGVDDAGRRQYVYHAVWRERRDAAKFDRVLEMARRLPKARAQVSKDLSGETVTRTRAMACAVRLIDLGLFRVGSDVYAEEHGSYGLTTMLRTHVRKKQACLVFSYDGKSGIEQEVVIEDPDVCSLVDRMRRRHSAGDGLLAYQDGRAWREVDADSVNAYLVTLFGGDVTAKDFRTWHATVIAAVALAEDPKPGETKTARRKVIRRAVVEVSEYLGNSPAIARSSYVDPRVIDLYEDGTTIATSLRGAPKDPSKRQQHLERATLRMLSEAAGSDSRAARPRRP
jgi:DNA topoisomerase I